MGTVSETVGIFGDLLGWVGLGAGGFMLAIWAIVRLVEGRWLTTAGVIIGEPGHYLLRWISADGVVCERRIDDATRDLLVGEPELPVHYARHLPHRASWDGPGNPARALWILGLVLCGVGLVAFAVSLLVGFLPR